LDFGIGIGYGDYGFWNFLAGEDEYSCDIHLVLELFGSLI
jgi:hypothetical protein